MPETPVGLLTAPAIIGLPPTVIRARQNRSNCVYNLQDTSIRFPAQTVRDTCL